MLMSGTTMFKSMHDSPLGIFELNNFVDFIQL